MRGRWEVTDAQWARLQLLLEPKRRADGRGRPWQDTRQVLNGVLWVLGTGAQWRELPSRYPPYQTFIAVSSSGCGRTAGAGVARAGRGTAGPRAARLGGSLCRCHLRGREKGGLAVGPTKRGKGTKILAVADGHGLPLAVSVQSASPHESQLLEEVLAQSFLDELPSRLIGDRAYDSDRLDQQLLARYGIELIAPHLRTPRQPTQDGRPLRRYRRRWRVERLFAWLHWFRRLVTRWEYHIENFFGMIRLGCIKLLLRHI